MTSMRKVHLILGFLFILWSIGESQVLPTEFGMVFKRDLEMDSFQSDTTVQAVILFERGETIIDRSFGTKFTIHRRIKFFKKNIADQWGNFVVRAPRKKISNFKGASYNLINGSIVKSELNQELTYKHKYSKTIDELGFTFTNIQDGSIIEYTYTIWSDYYVLMDWYFQHDIPTLWSEYSLQYGLGGGFNVNLNGNFEVTRYMEKSEFEPYTWVMTDLPAFKPETFMPHEDLYKSILRIWPKSTTWETIYNRLIDNPSFGGIMRDNNHLTKTVKMITKDLHEPKDKLKAISNYIKNHVEWTGVCDFVSRDPKEVLESGQGDSGDINLLLASMLERAGMHFNIVLTSTRDNGVLLKEIPSSFQFNYVICSVQLDNEYILMDATDKLLPYDVLPTHCANLTGFLLTGKGFEWITLNSKAVYKSSTTANLTLNGNNELEGEIHFIKAGYSGFEARRDFLKKGEQSYIHDLWYGRIVRIEKSAIENIDSIDNPLIEKFQLTIQDCSTTAGNIVYINPFVAFKESINPFKEEKRNYPIDFGSGKEEFLICNIAIPDSYDIKHLPESKNIILSENSARFAVNFSKIGNRIQVTCNFKINKAFINEVEYIALRELYTRLISKKNEFIILERK